MKQIDRIRKSSDTFGSSGFEDAIVAYTQEEVRGICTCKEDHMYNLYMNLKGDSQGGVNIMLDAHSDEVGFIVQAVKSNRPLRFLLLGGWDVKNIIANRALIRNRDDKLIPRIVRSKPIYFTNASERGKALDFADVLIDVGATSMQEVQKSFRIGTGAPIVPDATCTYDEEHQTLTGKVSDNRIGCAAVVEALCRLHGRTLMSTISAALSSQEEVGERGMICVINNMKLDIVTCLEGCPTDDSFEEEYMIQGVSKKGLIPRHLDRSTITSPRFQRFASELVHTNDTPAQESVRKGGGTNGGITHTTQFDIPTIVIGVPVRCAHSSYEILAYQDYEHAVELAVQIVEGLGKSTVESF